MKVALVLTLCGLVMVLASPEDLKAIEIKVLQQCRDETGFSADQSSKEISQEDLPPDEKDRYDCFLACLFKKLRIMKANGEVDKEFILDQSPQWKLQNVHRSIEDCQSKNIRDTCKLAYCIADGGWFDMDRYKHLLVLNKE